MADTDLLPCPFCGKAMMLRGALWPSEGDRDAVIHAEPTDCPMYDFANDTFDGSIVEVWNRRAPSPSPAPGAVTDEPTQWLFGLPSLQSLVEKGKLNLYDKIILVLREDAASALASLSQPAKGEQP